jgi:hypothetical protein
MQFVQNDGGRAAAGFKGPAGDCVTRAIAIASGLPYRQVYDAMAAGNAGQRASKHVGKRPKTANRGIYTTRKWFKDYMASIGFVFVATMTIGSGCKVHLRQDELPSGRIIVNLSRHAAAVIDGVLHDTFDCSRDGSRCVYGYWIKE